MTATWRVRLGGFIIALLFLTPAVAFALLHLLTPSDGARLEPGDMVWQSNGVVVTPLVEQTNGLRAGDVVVAVEGIPLESYAQSVFDPERARPLWQFGQSVRYSVLRAGQSLDVNVTLGAYPFGAILVKNWSALLMTVFTQILITIVFILRPRDHAVQALYRLAWSFVHTYTWSLGLQVGDIVSGAGFWLYQLAASGAWLVFWSAGLEFALVFPREHPLLKNRAWLIRVVYFASFLLFGLELAVAGLIVKTRLDWFGQWLVADWLIAALFAILAISAIVVNYFSTRDLIARQKIRWLMFSFFLFSAFGLVTWFLPALLLGHTLIDANALGLSLLPFPVVLAIAILYNKLFDIDIIIHRTLVYGALTLTLALFYYGSVLVLGTFRQWFFASVIGQPLPELGTVISTLGTAALFVPLRHRIQDIIDRRFYRRKYDAQKVLAEFARGARDETDLDKLAERLVDIIQETMEPEDVSLWLRPATAAEKYLTVIAAQKRTDKNNRAR